jgi:hypothetical protein
VFSGSQEGCFWVGCVSRARAPLSLSFPAPPPSLALLSLAHGRKKNAPEKQTTTIKQQMLKNSGFPGSNNGTGLLQSLVALKVREVYERITAKEVVVA